MAYYNLWVKITVEIVVKSKVQDSGSKIKVKLGFEIRVNLRVQIKDPNQVKHKG